MKKQLFNNHIFAAALFIGLALILFLGSMSITSRSASGEIGSAFFPRFVAVMLLICSIFPLVKGIERYRHGEKDDREAPYHPDDKDAIKGFNRLTELHPKALTIVLIFLYAVSMESIGFIISTAVYLFLQMIVLSKPSERNYIMFLILSVVVPVVMYFTFAKAFQTFLPAGLLSSFLM